MASSQTVKQEMPPQGGYPGIEYKRNLPRRGISGTGMFIVGGAIMAVGFFFVIRGNKRRREIRQEQFDARHYVRPLVQAEEDRRILGRLKMLENEEARIMKDVPGWVVGENVYSHNRWVSPVPEQFERY